MTETQTLELEVPSEEFVEELAEASGYPSLDMFIMETLDKATNSIDSMDEMGDTDTVEVELPEGSVEAAEELMDSDREIANVEDLLSFIIKNTYTQIHQQ